MMNRNIPILYFHSIAPAKDKGWYKNHLTLELIYFEDLIKRLSKNKYIFIHLDEYFHLISSNNYSKEKYICLTFDDGYLDNYVFAYPILRKYNAKGTIFVCPEYTPDNPGLRPTLENVKEKIEEHGELKTRGFISWEEMKEMEYSGIIDIQSHTLTHDKVISSDRIIEFHNPKSDYLYNIGEQFRERKPYYLEDKNFINLIPYGTPFFERKSSLITRKREINEEFVNKCIKLLSTYNWDHYSFKECNKIIFNTYKEYKNENKLITKIESEDEYNARVKNELILSKEIIENKLNKSVKYLCWPHGDYNQKVRQIALDTGYKATTIVVNPKEKYDFNNGFTRVGISPVCNNRFFTKLKTILNIGYLENTPPYYQIKSIYYYLRY